MQKQSKLFGKRFSSLREWPWAFPAIMVGTIVVSILGYLGFKKKNMF